MTVFGWIYLVLTILGSISQINEIGKPRKPLTSAEVSAKILISALLFVGLFYWGIRA